MVEDPTAPSELITRYVIKTYDAAAHSVFTLDHKVVF
jgi:hypothetical protein